MPSAQTVPIPRPSKQRKKTGRPLLFQSSTTYIYIGVSQPVFSFNLSAHPPQGFVRRTFPTHTTIASDDPTRQVSKPRRLVVNGNLRRQHKAHNKLALYMRVPTNNKIIVADIFFLLWQSITIPPSHHHHHHPPPKSPHQ